MSLKGREKKLIAKILLQSNESNAESMIRVKPSSGDQSDADGYNGNARYYLQQAKRVHNSVKPTDDEQMVTTLQL